MGGNENSPFEMNRNDKGDWTVTVPALVPGFHYYWFSVDGFAANDPGSETFYGYSKEVRGIEVPDSKGDFYVVADVPHGEVRARWYYSRVSASCGARWFTRLPIAIGRLSDVRSCTSSTAWAKASARGRKGV